MSRFILLTGCSGGGKSTLLAELARRGYATVPEPGRRIVAEERATGGTALPWTDAVAFAHRALTMARTDLADARGLTLFDRGTIDAALALEHLTGTPAGTTLGPTRDYDPRVFLLPPWAEIFGQDDARRHGLDDAIAEYDRISAALPGLGYTPVLVPRAPVADRADFVVAHLAADTASDSR